MSDISRGDSIINFKMVSINFRKIVAIGLVCKRKIEREKNRKKYI